MDKKIRTAKKSSFNYVCTLTADFTLVCHLVSGIVSHTSTYVISIHRHDLRTFQSANTHAHTRTAAFVLGCVFHCADSIGTYANV